MSAASLSPDHPPADLAGLAARITRPVVLVGLMGVGKSTVGRKLAGLLKRDFVDADEAIVEAAQLSIAEIFAQFGEPYFRDGERRVIARLIEEGHGVIATGGGAFVDPATRALILERGIAVWIDADIDTLVERTARKGDRPLLANGDAREILTKLAQERNPLYAQAHVHVKSQSTPHEATLDAIMKALS